MQILSLKKIILNVTCLVVLLFQTYRFISLRRLNLWTFSVWGQVEHDWKSSALEARTREILAGSTEDIHTEYQLCGGELPVISLYVACVCLCVCVSFSSSLLLSLFVSLPITHTHAHMHARTHTHTHARTHTHTLSLSLPPSLPLTNYSLWCHPRWLSLLVLSCFSLVHITVSIPLRTASHHYCWQPPPPPPTPNNQVGRRRGPGKVGGGGYV